MTTDMIQQLPMWLSFAVTLVGLVFSVLLARLARGGVLYRFTILLTIGILVFAVHHLLELTVTGPWALVSGLAELTSSAIFLAATIDLGLRLRKVIYGP